MDCTLTGDTPSWLLALTFALVAVAVGLWAEAIAVGVALHWRARLARWVWALALPVVLAIWCVARAVGLWQLDAALVSSKDDAMGALIEHCAALATLPTLGELSLAAGMIVLAVGVLILYLLPSRGGAGQRAARRAPVWPATAAVVVARGPRASGVFPFLPDRQASPATRWPGYASGEAPARYASRAAASGVASANGGMSRAARPPAWSASSGALPAALDFATPAEPTRPLDGAGSSAQPPSLPPLPRTSTPLSEFGAASAPTVRRVPRNPFGVEATPTQVLSPSGT